MKGFSIQGGASGPKQQPYQGWECTANACARRRVAIGTALPRRAAAWNGRRQRATRNSPGPPARLLSRPCPRESGDVRPNGLDSFLSGTAKADAKAKSATRPGRRNAGRPKNRLMAELWAVLASASPAPSPAARGRRLLPGAPCSGDSGAMAWCGSSRRPLRQKSWRMRARRPAWARGRSGREQGHVITPFSLNCSKYNDKITACDSPGQERQRLESRGGEPGQGRHASCNAAARRLS